MWGARCEALGTWQRDGVESGEGLMRVGGSTPEVALTWPARRYVVRRPQFLPLATLHWAA